MSITTKKRFDQVRERRVLSLLDQCTTIINVPPTPQQEPNNVQELNMGACIKYHTCQNYVASKSIRFKQLQPRKLLTVLLYSWLFLNTDPTYSQRTLGSMMASKLINRTLLRPLGAKLDASASRSGHGMSTIEAIALIQAINGNRGAQSIDPESLRQLIEGGRGSTARKSHTALATRQHSAISNRQVPVPVPLPVPAPIVAVVAALAALVAAIAAGLTPFAAIAVAVVAAAVALLAIVLAVIAALVVPIKAAPIVKKLVIKKTVLPFVIPIPFKQKEKEKEIIYKYIPKPIHIHHKEKEHKHEHEHYEFKHKYKHKKVDLNTARATSPEGQDSQAMNEQGSASLDKIENLIVEQDSLQKLVDNVIEIRPDSPMDASMMDNRVLKRGRRTSSRKS